MVAATYLLIVAFLLTIVAIGVQCAKAYTSKP